MLAIILDIDDTVYRQQAVFEQAICQHIAVEQSQLDTLFMASRKYSDLSFIQLQKGELTREEMYIYRLTQAFLDIDVQITPQQALAIQRDYEYQQQRLQLDPDIIHLLDYCQHHEITLGMITNGGSRQQWQKVKNLGLLKWIDKEAIIVSEDVGIIKPNPKIFQLLEDKLTLQADQTYYIGDAFHNDVIGALSAGWGAIWLNQYDLPISDERYQPHYMVKTRRQLLSIVQQLKA